MFQAFTYNIAYAHILTRIKTRNIDNALHFENIMNCIHTELSQRNVLSRRQFLHGASRASNVLYYSFSPYLCSPAVLSLFILCVCVFTFTFAFSHAPPPSLSLSLSLSLLSVSYRSHCHCTDGRIYRYIDVWTEIYIYIYIYICVWTATHENTLRLSLI